MSSKPQRQETYGWKQLRTAESSQSDDLAVRNDMSWAQTLIFGHGVALFVGPVTISMAAFKENWSMLKFALVSVLLYETVRAVHDHLVNWTEKYNLDKTMIIFMERCLKYISSAVVMYCILWCLGVVSGDTDPQIVAAFSLAWGLATQNMISNFAAGAILVALRPFHVGDIINVHGVYATVTGIGLFFVRADDFENHRIYLPNSKMLDTPVVANWSKNESQVFKLFVHVRTGQCSCNDVRKALEHAAAEIDNTVGDIIENNGCNVDPDRPKSVVNGPLEFTSEGMQWVLKVTGPSAIFDPFREHCMSHMHDALYDAGIEIFERRTIPSKPT